jgi:hypothetical protein
VIQIDTLAVRLAIFSSTLMVSLTSGEPERRADFARCRLRFGDKDSLVGRGQNRLTGSGWAALVRSKQAVQVMHIWQPPCSSIASIVRTHP